MAGKQRRILCKECHREWIEPRTGMYQNSAPLSITGNKRDDLCPICGSGSIEEVIFTPFFAGGDIPRDQQIVPETLIHAARLAEIEKEAEEINKQVAPGFIANNLIANMIKETETNKEEYNPVFDLSDMD